MSVSYVKLRHAEIKKIVKNFFRIPFDQSSSSSIFSNFIINRGSQCYMDFFAHFRFQQYLNCT